MCKVKKILIFCELVRICTRQCEDSRQSTHQFSDENILSEHSADKFGSCGFYAVAFQIKLFYGCVYLQDKKGKNIFVS